MKTKSEPTMFGLDYDTFATGLMCLLGGAAVYMLLAIRVSL